MFLTIEVMSMARVFICPCCPCEFAFLLDLSLTMKVFGLNCEVSARARTKTCLFAV